MSSSGSDRLDEAESRLSGRNTLGDLMLYLFGGTMITIAYQFWELIESLGATIMAPFQAFARGLSELVYGTIGGPVRLLDASVQTGVRSVTEGLFSQLGLFAYPVTMISVVAGIYIFARAWELINLSPWNFLRSLR